MIVFCIYLFGGALYLDQNNFPRVQTRPRTPRMEETATSLLQVLLCCSKLQTRAVLGWFCCSSFVTVSPIRCVHGLSWQKCIQKEKKCIFLQWPMAFIVHNIMLHAVFLNSSHSWNCFGTRVCLWGAMSVSHAQITADRSEVTCSEGRPDVLDCLFSGFHYNLQPRLMGTVVFSNFSFSCLLFQLLAPAVDWLDFLTFSLAPLDLNDTEPVVVYAREYLQQVSELINKTDRRWVLMSPGDERLMMKIDPYGCRFYLQSAEQLHDLDLGSEGRVHFGSTLRERSRQTAGESIRHQEGTSATASASSTLT